LYKDKTIVLVVGYSVGGGYDQYARMLARHIGRHLPGSPNVIVQNMPGASSLTAVRYLDAGAPKDGTVMTTFDPGLVTESFTSPEKLQLKFSNYYWIGAIMRDLRVCYAWGVTGIKSWEDMMQRKEFILGSTAKGSSNYVNGAILRNIFKAPVRQVTGYPGSAEQRLAIERGELDGACPSWSAMPPDWIAEKKTNPFVSFSRARTADMPEGIPFIGDFAKTQEQRDLLNVLIAPGELGRPFIASKQVPIDRVAILRAAFDTTMKDQEFLSDAEKQNLPVSSASGAEADTIIETIYAAPAELAAKAKEALQ
jgi:tripartite-type tricarboxylate transporter receptor subunit TctC